MKENLPRMARHIVNIEDEQYFAFLKEITNSKGENVMIVAYSKTEHKLTIGEKDILNKIPVPEKLPGKKQEGPEEFFTTGLPVGHAVLKVKIGEEDYYAYYVDGVDADGNDKRIVAYSLDVKVIETQEEYSNLKKLPSPNIEDLMTWTKARGENQEKGEKFLSSETPKGEVTTVLRVIIDNKQYYAYYDKAKKGFLGGTEPIVAYSINWKVISPVDYNKLKELEPDPAELKQWKTAKGTVLSSKQPVGATEVAKAQPKPQPVAKTEPVAQPKKLAPEKIAAIQQPKPEPVSVPVQATPVHIAPPDEEPKQEPVVSAAIITPPVQQPVLQQPEHIAQPDEGAKQEHAVPVPVRPVEEPEPRPVTVHAAVTPVHVDQDEKPKEAEFVTIHSSPTPTIKPSTPAVQPIVQGFKESALDDAAPKSHLGEHEPPRLQGKPPLPPKPIVQPKQQMSSTSDDYAVEKKQLKESIKNQVTSFFHRNPTATEQTKIDVIARRIIENKLEYKSLTPKSMHTMIKNFIKDYNPNSSEGITKAALEEAQKVIVFDSVWKAVDSSFKVHKNDYDELRRHVDKIPKWETGNLGEFIKGFKGTIGGNNKISRSQLFTKDFDEAMKLHVGDPVNSKALLEALKKDKAYDPAKLCKAYVSCMKNIQDYRLTLTKAEKAGSEDKIKGFIAEAANAISSQGINDKSLSELRDKLIPNTLFLSSPKVKPNEFAKEFNKQFPTLNEVLKGMVGEKSVDKEMQKLVLDLANKLKVDDKNHPDLDPYIRVHKMLSELEVQTRETKPERQQESVKNFLSFMNIEEPKGAKDTQKAAQRS